VKLKASLVLLIAAVALLAKLLWQPITSTVTVQDVSVAGIHLGDSPAKVKDLYPGLKEVSSGNWMQPHGSDEYCALGSVGFADSRATEVFGYSLEIKSKRFSRQDRIADLEKILGPAVLVKTQKQDGSKLHWFKKFSLRAEAKEDSTMYGGFYLMESFK